MSPPPSERAEADALLTDLYLDALLAARERHATDAPTAAALDPAIRAVAARLAADLDRVHPSFRFEERLAARLAEAAARLRLAMAAGAEASTARRGGTDPARSPDDPADEIGSWPVDADPTGDAEVHGRGRPLLIGGALTSAAISIAGAAAYVAWRRARPLTPLARAVRGVGQGRLAHEPGSPPERLD
ncbi:MAG TPA: hypothetical protein VF323_05005 [Candidatus Limnocylindrales bacterium]